MQTEIETLRAERFLNNRPQARQLKIKLQQDINFNLHQALPLCILLANDNIYPWYYENYVQLYSTHTIRKYVAGAFIVDENTSNIEELGVVALNFLATPYRWLKAFTLKPFLGGDPDDILDFIIRSINLDCYLKIEVDEYYLPNKARYKKDCFIHPTLIYGYDNLSRKLMGIGYDQNMFFSMQTLDYDDFSKAYASAKQVFDPLNSGLVTLIKPKAIGHKYAFSVERFLNELYHYLYSIKDSEKAYYLFSFLPADAEARGQLKFGFDVYSHLDTSLQDGLRGKRTVEYKDFHLLFEHKKALAGAFKLIISEHKVRGLLLELFEDFDKLTVNFHSLRSKFFRYLCTGSVELLKEIIEMMYRAKEEEWNLLARIHEQSELLSLA